MAKQQASKIRHLDRMLVIALAGIKDGSLSPRRITVVLMQQAQTEQMLPASIKQLLGIDLGPAGPEMCRVRPIDRIPSSVSTAVGLAIGI